MSITLTEIDFFLAAIACLIIGGAIHIVRTLYPAIRWTGGQFRLDVEQTFVVLALLCVVLGLASSVLSQRTLPLTMPAEVIAASAAGALFWYCLPKRDHEPAYAVPFFYTIVAALLVWAVTKWPAPQAFSIADRWRQIWLSASRLALALACGAFVESGSLALASLLTKREANAARSEGISRHSLLLGLPLLAASLLITSFGGQYTSGVYWSWTASESWQLLVWLFYAILWCAMVLLDWYGQRLWLLEAVGLILTLLLLNALGG